MGCFELKRERHRVILICAGRVVRCAKGRWARKVNDLWGKVGKGMKSWKAKVAELVKMYGLEEAFDEVGRGQGDWRKAVDAAVLERGVEEWKDGVRAGRKLDVYGQVKTDWGFEPYLEGRYGEGERLMVRFRSGSALIGEEMER